MVERINDIYFTHEEFKAILKHYGEVIRDTAPWNNYEEKIPYECYRRFMKECIKGIRLIEDVDNNYYFYDDDEAKYQEAKEYFAENSYGAIVRYATAPTEPLIMIMNPGHDFCDFLRNYYLVYRPDWYAPRKEEREEKKDMAAYKSNIDHWCISYDAANTSNDTTTNKTLAWNTEYENVWETSPTISWNDNHTATFTIDNVNVSEALKELAGAAQSTAGAIGSLGNKIKKLNDKNEKENEKMKGFNFDFGPCTNDNVKMSMYGIAVKNQAGEWVSYNPASGEIINVDIFNFDGRKYMFKMPVAIKDIAVGDVVVHSKKPMIVVGIEEDGSGLIVVDTHAGEEKKIIPTRSPFGFNFITKIVSMFDNICNTDICADNPFGNFWMFALMNDNADVSNILPLMMMSGNTTLDPMMMMLCMGEGDSGKDWLLPFMMMQQQGNR